MSSTCGGGNITGGTTSEIGQDKDNNHGNNKRRNTIDLVTKHFKGDNANIGAVIGLKHEIIDAKKDFEKFTQKIAPHVATNVTMGTYLAPMITNDVKSETSYDKDMKPRGLKQAKLSDNKKLWKLREETKLYLYGQCSPSIQEG